MHRVVLGPPVHVRDGWTFSFPTISMTVWVVERLPSDRTATWLGPVLPKGVQFRIATDIVNNRVRARVGNKAYALVDHSSYVISQLPSSSISYQDFPQARPHTNWIAPKNESFCTARHDCASVHSIRSLRTQPERISILITTALWEPHAPSD